jgi:hypothetical protein
MSLFIPIHYLSFLEGIGTPKICSIVGAISPSLPSFTCLTSLSITIQGTRLVVCAVFGAAILIDHVIGIAMVGYNNERIAML